MGILRLYATLVQSLCNQPNDATRKSLDGLASAYRDFAYIGSRRSLRTVVLEQAESLHQRLSAIDEQFWQEAAQKHLKLLRRLKECQKKSNAEKVATAWYGRRDWAKDSGVFPDFVLALDNTQTFGNGAILELKDSDGSTIASFNSTIPTRFKSLTEVGEIMNSKMVEEAVWIYDFPHSLAEDYLSKERHCFYLIRTHRHSQEQVRISLVEGSFFETLPKRELLQRVWEQILNESGVPEEQKQQLLPLLAQLEQSLIARSRHIEGASVKPRFRIMAEVESEANIHLYPEIAPRTVNLVIKREQTYDWEWLQKAFSADRVDVVVTPKGNQAILEVRETTLLCCFSIWHLRNGEHWCLQWQLP
ncbi:MAG: hypothetical protein QXY94_06565 [Archaeoglobaceae archaeon]